MIRRVFRALTTRFAFLFTSSFATSLGELLFHEKERLSGDDVVNELKKTRCNRAQPRPCPIPHASALYDYRLPTVRNAIWRIKYKKDTLVARAFGEALSQFLLEYLERIRHSKPILLIPIPLSKQRLRERGYNQNELVLKYCILEGGIDNAMRLATDVLQKTRHTLSQSHTLSRDERLINLKEVFIADPQQLTRGQVCILIDDVLTTGSTMTEARQALFAAGAQTVYCIALAR